MHHCSELWNYGKAMSRIPYSADAMEERLVEILWSERSSMRPVAEDLSKLTFEQQRFALHWIKALESSNSACAFHFASHASNALNALPPGDVEAWIVQAMDVYDSSGLYAAVEVFRDVDGFQERQRVRNVGIEFQDVSFVLERFITGLSGRRLRLESGSECYTDTETLFLPEITSLFQSQEDNFTLLKSTAVYLWAQTRFGTWRQGVIEILAAYSQPDRALRLFQALELLRLDAVVSRELPGTHRDMSEFNRIRGQSICPPGWERLHQRLRDPVATVCDSLIILDDIYATEAVIPITVCYQGECFPDRVEVVLQERMADELAGLRSLLVKFQDELEEANPELMTIDRQPFTLAKNTDYERPEDYVTELMFNGQPVTPPEDIRALMQSIMLDLGEIPDEYLTPAGDGDYVLREHRNQDEDLSADVWSGTYHEIGAHLYDEWDYHRQNYRKGWCVLRELDVEPLDDGFVTETREKYSSHLASLRKTFEALRGEDKRLKKEVYGDEVDIDALVEAHADVATGVEMTDRLFTRLHKVERNLAVMFMVDMSGSTRGWINKAERESLVLLCEALETLGDRYAIYGFSGMTRKRCEVYRVKDFSDRYDAEIRNRISGIEAKDYTRMGVAIRHLSAMLNQVEAKTRVLITLSDGKPDDYNDEYRGEYGIEDTRRALIEAKRTGIHPFCITIDKEGQDYLPHMYGPVNYTIVDTVEQLPYKVSDIYRRLTT